MKRIKWEDLFEDNLEYQIGPENKYGIIFGDIFYFYYQGINVFFYVVRHNSTQVCLIEIAKKKIKYNGKTVEVLCPGFKPTRSPNVITHENCEQKSTFWVTIKDEEHIFIPITSDMPIYKKVKYPMMGDFIACKIPDEEKAKGLLNFYWEIL